jgi:phosphohistidine phosphatase
MEIYVLRHGTAETARAGSSDAVRALTKDGREKLGWVMERARAAGVAPAVILTSPYVRAVETAEMAAAALAPAAPMVRTEALVPDSTPEAIWEEIRRRGEEPSVLLVGHEPLLGETISYLLAAPRVIVDFKKGAMARIDVGEISRRPGGVLVWLVTPRLAKAE